MCRGCAMERGSFVAEEIDRQSIDIEFLMRLHAPTAGPAHQIDKSLVVFHAEGGWAKGPKIDGAIISPTADWMRVMPSGAFRVDARMMIRTNDDALISVSYGGVISVAADDFMRMAGGATLTSDNMYFITTPVFQTSHEKYAWLNRIQAVAKVVGVKGGDGGFVSYDVFAVK